MRARTTRPKRRTRKVVSRQTDGSGFFPDVQIASTGTTISLVDSMVSSLVTAVAVVVLAWLVGFTPFSFM